MKKTLLDILECPECRSEIGLLKDDGGEQIESGVMECKGCSRNYPIINGIPRILPDALMSTVFDRYPEEMKELCDYNIGGRDCRDIDWATLQKRRTSGSFGYQWNTFSTMYEAWKDNFLDYVMPLEEQFFAGKRGLDMGCGFGRHLYWAGKFGAEMVGLDLSGAVEAAYRNTRDLPNVQVVQGDIFNMPFKKGTFDFGYSIGVLHHLPDPRGGFSKLVEVVRPGGTVFGWVYGVRRGPVEWFSKALRAFTTRMNYRMLHVLCVLIAVFLRIFSHYPYRVMSRIGPLKGLAERLPIKEHSKLSFSATVGDAFDRLSVPITKYYNGDEFREWFETEKLTDIRIIRRYKNNESWRGVGIKPS